MRRPNFLPRQPLLARRLCRGADHDAIRGEGQRSLKPGRPLRFHVSRVFNRQGIARRQGKTSLRQRGKACFHHFWAVGQAQIKMPVCFSAARSVARIIAPATFARAFIPPSAAGYAPRAAEKFPLQHAVGKRPGQCLRNSGDYSRLCRPLFPCKPSPRLIACASLPFCRQGDRNTIHLWLYPGDPAASPSSG